MTRPNDIRKLVNELNKILTDENKLVICNLRNDGSFTVKRNNKHGIRVLNVEKNTYGNYFIKFYPFLDMSEGHSWAVRDMEYATYKTPAVEAFKNTILYGKQSDEYLERFGLNNSFYKFRNNESTLGVFMLDNCRIARFKELLLMTIVAQREQIDERNKMAKLKKAEKRAAERLEEKHGQMELDARKHFVTVKFL